MPGSCREAWVVRRRRESVWFKRAQICVADRVADRRRSPTLFHDFLQEHAEVGMMAVSAMQELGNETARTLLRPLEARAHELYRAVIDDALAAGTIRAPFDTADLLLVMRMVIAAASQEETREGRTRMISKGIEIVLSGLSSLGSKRKNSS